MGLFDIFSDKPAQDAAAAKKAGIQAGINSATGTLDTAQAGADKLYGQAYSPFSTLYDKFGKGLDSYLDATGANGPEGVARAAALFKSMPGYSGGLTTGTDQLLRTAAARGDTGGNLSADIIKFASDYDANKYGNFVQSLAPTLSGATTAATGGAGVLTGQAAADLGVAGQKANYGYGGNVAMGQADADAELAKYGASSNFWNALMGGAGLALKASGIGGFAPGGK